MNEVQKIVIVKVGTNTLLRQDVGGERLDEHVFRHIGRQIAALYAEGAAVVLVSSAAITAGMMVAGVKERPQEMAPLQRLASIGWRHIVNHWDEALPERRVGELLLTRRELTMQNERDEVLRVTHELLKNGDVPVVNENDSISHEEIAFGDNDTLAATFAAKIRRSPLFCDDVRLVLLSDVEGMYADPRDKTTRIATIADFAQCEKAAAPTGSSHGTGGMATKLAAARIAANDDVPTWIAAGYRPDSISEAFRGENGTHFLVSV